MAATDVRNDQTFNGNELRNFRLEILGSHFVSPQTGQPWYLTTTNAAYYWDGTDNVPMDARLRTGIPITNLASLGSGVATWLATPSSANLLAAITDETGTGALVFATSPSLVTPALGVATATTVNKLTFTAPATGATLTLADGSTLSTAGAFASTFTFTGATNVTFPTSGTLATTSALAGYQPLDSDLTTIAGLTATTDNFIQSKSGAWASRTVAQVKTDLGLTGTNSGDQTITLSGIVAGSGTGAITTTAGAGFDTAVRLNRLDQLTAPTSAVAMGSQRITGLATPSVGTDAATKQYVEDYVDDAVVSGTAGIDMKDSVDTATVSNITLSGVQNISGFTGAVGTNVLVKSQTTAADNGIYVMASGAWTRRADAAAGKLTKGSTTLVVSGTLTGTSWMLTTADPITVGSTAQTWVQFNAANTYGPADASIAFTGNAIAVNPTPLGTDIPQLLTTGAGLEVINVAAGTASFFVTGNGVVTTFDINHNYGTRSVVAHVRNASNQLVMCGQDTSLTTKLVLTIKPPIPNGVTWDLMLVAVV